MIAMGTNGESQGGLESFLNTLKAASFMDEWVSFS